ncbi:MAG: ABC transporter ATP-binding protein [Sphingobacteriales bacterium 17-39-43]|nr:ATP-binding cassette domain-containing protein [Pedobacter sp.]OYZ32306.1 MAG: ABC transporter ATP-binding protein [Sphingobacteriales bacterium 16-39-50]OZA25650.1 MAG: ABC transporter ATP-binding protein [Sphingobacteriales bacterium 17-39-43]OZA60903.1 MAG: ABC transporter ATP-binding protein [Sphingobacteriales bacterium 39-40-5]HQS51050.1 ATP-binding cassette domain-containing protein [Daejeonella sp.]
MKINLEHIGRRFNREWIFRDVNYVFESGSSYAILGANGAGKSTILQVISGSLTSSEGTISYTREGVLLNPENVFEHLSMAAPYLELIEELTLRELIDFHFRFKKYRSGLNRDLTIELMGLKRSEHKAIKNFSSGMKQRVKLALAFCSDTDMILLDEPASNLDQQGLEWYLSLVEKYSADRILIICSNQIQEYSFCKNQLNVADYK